MSEYTEDLVGTRPLWSSHPLSRRILYNGRTPYVLLLVFIVVVYTSPAVLFPALAAFGPALIVAGLALASLLFEKVRNREGLWVVWPNSHLLFGFFAAAALSCLTATWARLSVETTI